MLSENLTEMATLESLRTSELADPIAMNDPCSKIDKLHEVETVKIARDPYARFTLIKENLYIGKAKPVQHDEPMACDCRYDPGLLIVQWTWFTFNFIQNATSSLMLAVRIV